MDGMTEDQTQEALDHDAARKESEGKGNGVADVDEGAEEQSTVATEQMVNALDVKNAYLAKSTALTYIDLALACAGLAREQVMPAVDLQGNTRGVKADPKRTDQLLGFAERAVKLALDLDVLGDKNIIRATSKQ